MRHVGRESRSTVTSCPSGRSPSGASSRRRVPTSSRQSRTTTRRSCPSTTPASSSFSARLMRAGSKRAIPTIPASRGRSGTSSRRPGSSRGVTPFEPAAGSARTGMWAFDTLTVIGEGTWEGGARRGRLRAHRCRSRRRRRDRLRLHAAAGSPRHALGLRWLVLSEQRSGRGTATSRERRRSGRDRRCRRAPRQRRPGDLLGARRRPHGLGPRRPARRLVPALPRGRDRGRSGRGGGCEPQSPASAGYGDDEWLAAVDELARWVDGVDALVVALGVDAAAGDPNSPLLVTRRAIAAPAHGSRGSSCRRWSSRKAATTSPRSARSCRSFLEGLG